MLNTGKKPKEIKWRVPSEEGWTRMPVQKVPTAWLIQIYRNFEKKGLSKIRSLVTNQQPWVIDYMTELETELDKRKDVDEYL